MFLEIFPFSGQGRPSKISSAPWIGAHKGRGVDEVRGKTVVADEGKPILQTDLKFSNSNSNCGQRSAGCGGQFRWRTIA